MVSDAVREKVNKFFPAFGYLLDVPEVAAVLERAVTQEWTPDTFEANLRATDWWRTQTDKQRARATLEATDPATATNAVNALKAQIKSQAASYGREMTDDRAGALAWAAFRGAWDDAAIRSAIASDAGPNQAQQVDIRGLARAYMVDLPESTIADMTRRMFTGELPADAVKNYVLNQAIAQYPSQADQLKAGLQTRDLFAPHRQVIGDLLGIDPETVDLQKNPTWQQAIQHADDKGQIRPMTTAELTRYVRSTSEFMSSDRGQKEAATFATNFARSVGGLG